MTLAVQAAFVAAALGCGAPVPPVEAAPHRQAGSEVSSQSQGAASATTGPSRSAIRDPFVRPVLTPSALVDDRAAGEGLAAASYDDIVVRGVVQTWGDRVALVETPDGKYYRVRAGERLRDGRVQAVSPEGVLILPDTSAGGVRSPEPVRKPLGADSRDR